MAEQNADHRNATQDCMSFVDAADRLGISVRTLRRQVSAGTIRSVRIGRRHLIRCRAIDDFLDASERRAA